MACWPRGGIYKLANGMAWHGIWHGLALCGMVWHGYGMDMVWHRHGMIWYGHGMILGQDVMAWWYGMAWHGMAWCMVWWRFMAWHGMAWYGMVWYGMVWYGMAWHGMTWHGMVWYGANQSYSRGCMRSFSLLRHFWFYWTQFGLVCISYWLLRLFELGSSNSGVTFYYQPSSPCWLFLEI